jgi:hypothetical protein
MEKAEEKNDTKALDALFAKQDSLAPPLQARYYRSLIRNLTSQALIE